LEKSRLGKRPRRIPHGRRVRTQPGAKPGNVTGRVASKEDPQRGRESGEETTKLGDKGSFSRTQVENPNQKSSDELDCRVPEKEKPKKQNCITRSLQKKYEKAEVFRGPKNRRKRNKKKCVHPPVNS